MEILSILTLLVGIATLVMVIAIYMKKDKDKENYNNHNDNHQFSLKDESGFIKGIFVMSGTSHSYGTDGQGGLKLGKIGWTDCDIKFTSANTVKFITKDGEINTHVNWIGSRGKLTLNGLNLIWDKLCN